MTCYFKEPRTRKYVKEYGFLSFSRNPSNKHEKQSLDAGLDALKPASKKTDIKAAEATDYFIGNKIADKV